MNIICFSSHSAGGIMCDLLNNTSMDRVASTRKRMDPQYVIFNREHNMLKGVRVDPTIIVKDRILSKNSYIDISNGVFNNEMYLECIRELKYRNKPQDTWVGTHWHPTVIPNHILTSNKVIVITNERYASRLLLFIRLVNGIIKIGKGIPPWDATLGKKPNTDITEAILSAGFNINDLLDESIMFDLFPDQLRSLRRQANHRWKSHSLCQNVEFEDIVNGNFVRDNNLNIEVFNYWKSINPFLYQEPSQKLKDYFDSTW